MSDTDLKKILKKLDELEKKVDALVEADEEAKDILEGNPAFTEEQLEDAVLVITSAGKVSASYLQRVLGISFTTAVKIVDYLEEEGAVGPSDGARPREVLIDDPIKFLMKRKVN